MPGAWVHTGFAQRIHFGVGVVARLPQVLKETGARRFLLVTTGGRRSSAEGERVVRALGRSVVSTFDEVRSHVPTSVVEAALRQARRDGIDGVVSFGGGSCADLGKAVCYFLEQESGMPGASYVDRPSIAHVSIPTTYSGAELTPYFGMTDETARAKSGAGGPTIAPLAAVYDPELTLSTPPRVSAETGMNCIAHGVEAAYSPTRTPEAEAVALACVSRAAAALPIVVEEPADLPARVEMLTAAALGGRCLQNASMGVHHGLAQLLGGRTGISHGLANAIVLPHAMAFNQTAVPGELDRIRDALGDVGELVGRLGLPTRLSEVGVTEEDLDVVARLSQGSASVQANPRPVSEDDARMILEAAF